MDVRERIGDWEELLRALVEQRLTSVWTSLPGYIVPGSWDKDKQTVSIQPTVKVYIKSPDGTQKAYNLPVLPDVPIQFPGGGGHSMTWPIKGNEEVLVCFSSRSPDNWQQSSGEQLPADSSMHSLSGGFALLGFRSNPKALQDVDEDAVVLRSDDNKTKVSLNKDSGVSVDTDKAISVKSAQGIAMEPGAGQSMTVNMGGGDVHFVGASNYYINGLDFMTHRHDGGTIGAGDTGGPIA